MGNYKKYDVTRDNAAMLLTKAYEAAKNDAENIKYGLSIDIRGVKGIDAKGRYQDEEMFPDCSIEGIYAAADEIVKQYQMYGDDAFVCLECYWNDNEDKRAEPDDYGVELRNGKLTGYGFDEAYE